MGQGRFSDEDLEHVKSNIDLAALVRSKGIELKRHGSKDLAGLSPFTDEKTPSFIVTPGKNLWHCMSSGKGGTVIDFLIQHDGLSFRHAVELLKEEHPQVFGGANVQKSTVRKLEAPVSFDADDHALLDQTLDYYQKRLQETLSALEYLKKRGLNDPEALKTFRIGYADRSLGLRLPNKKRRDGEQIRERLTKLGIYRESGHEHFNGCLTFPIFDEQGRVSEVYGRKANQKQKNGIYHLYLPGPHRGIWNPDCLKSPDIILTESVIDALTFWVHGFKNVTCIYGTEGFTDEHLEAFKTHKTQKIYLAYDRDKGGDRAAERDAARLSSLGIDCFRVQFPAGHDPNSYALRVTPAAKSLQVLINAAQWWSSSSKNNKVLSNSTKELAANAERSDAVEQAAKGKKSHEQTTSVGSVPPCEIKAEDSPGPKSPAAPELEQKGGYERSECADSAKRKSDLSLTQSGDDYHLALQNRAYRIRGLQKNTTHAVLKVNLRVLSEGRFYLDVLDFYRAKDRTYFIAAAAAEVGLEPDLIKRDLGKLLFQLEALQEERIRAELEPVPQEVAISHEDKEAALDLLKSPQLLERILEDFEQCGIVGEATNKLTGYLAAVSRKLDKPLAIIIQSTSAAGKTSLMEAVLAMMPEEERIKYSAMTGQSLYYLGETNLKHKILAIVEEEGAEKASYALKLLQSEGELTIASTGKDEQGRMKTEEYHVEGPVMIFLTTTAVDIDEELLNRCLVLTVHESREQTEAIHLLQRQAEMLSGLERNLEKERILNTHQNAQRLLKSVNVVNPFAMQLTFLSDRTRTRR
ncbi:MAG: toprim domain-containing protein, partial [Opitutales bacterium]|nr:toprim domain-containing protein [Opitutales bacterium]